MHLRQLSMLVVFGDHVAVPLQSHIYKSGWMTDTGHTVPKFSWSRSELENMTAFWLSEMLLHICRKEKLWPHTREFADAAIQHCSNTLRRLQRAGEPCELYTVIRRPGPPPLGHMHVHIIACACRRIHASLNVQRFSGEGGGGGGGRGALENAVLSVRSVDDEALLR